MIILFEKVLEYLSETSYANKGYLIFKSRRILTGASSTQDINQCSLSNAKIHLLSAT